MATSLEFALLPISYKTCKIQKTILHNNPVRAIMGVNGGMDARKLAGGDAEARQITLESGIHRSTIV